jgi:hypothetical protein
MSQKVIMKGGYRRRFPVWGRARLINRNPRLINKGHVEDENSKLTSLPIVVRFEVVRSIFQVLMMRATMTKRVSTFLLWLLVYC